MCSPNGRKTNKKASSIKKRLYRSVLKLLLIFLARGEWELAPVPQDGCCGVIGPDPRPLSIRGTQIFTQILPDAAVWSSSIRCTACVLPRPGWALPAPGNPAFDSYFPRLLADRARLRPANAWLFE